MSAFEPVDVDDVLVTARGYQQLRAELEALRTVQRAVLTDQIREAREDRDPDNPLLFDLLEEQSQLEGRISLLEQQLAAARVVRPAADGTAGVGSCVRVRHRDGGDVAEYDLVGPLESDVGNGRISVAAPVGAALLGRRGGDTVVVDTPRGPAELEILAVVPAGARTLQERPEGRGSCGPPGSGSEVRAGHVTTQRWYGRGDVRRAAPADPARAGDDAA